MKLESVQREELVNIIDRYREYFLKIIIASGADAGDVDHPDQITFPPIEELALREVNELKDSYEELLVRTAFRPRLKNEWLTEDDEPEVPSGGPD